MKKPFFLLTVFLLATGIAFSQVSIKLTGGMAYILANDLNKGLQGENDFLTNEATYVSGEYNKLHMGMNFGGEIIFNFSPNAGIGMGAEYSQIGKESTLDYTIDIFGQFSEVLNLNIKVIPITLNFYYYIPAGSSIKFYLKVGAGYYITKFNMEDSLNAFSLGINTRDSLKVSKGTIGFQGIFGIEFLASEQISFVVEAGGRYAKLSELTGDWTRKGIDSGVPVYKSGTGSLWYYEWTPLFSRHTYPGIGISDREPSAINVTNVRKASLDLTGFSVKAGLKIRF